MKSTSNSKLNISDSASKSAPGKSPRGALRKKVYVGMSGGVDSSVSALLLKQQGYDVTGVFIKVWQPDGADCGWKDERRDAMRVAVMLDIPFKTFDFSEQYKREVVDYMIAEYKAGHTPNPDIMCNRHVKFGSFLRQALADGVDYVATGHYAQNIQKNLMENSGGSEITNEFFELHEGADKNKDQSYFLWTLTQEDLKHVLFPIGHMQKSEVREIARKYDLPVFDKKDSQGVCFIGHLDMKEFLKSHIETAKGDILDTAGRIIGQHDGAALYTIGERHGFTITNSSVTSEPHFIVAKDIANNTLTAIPKSKFNAQTNGAESAATMEPPKEVKLRNISWVGKSPEVSAALNDDAQGGKNNCAGFRCSARIRYRQERQPCELTKNSFGEWVVTFDEAQKGAAEGQSVVLYSKNSDACLGGGILTFI